MDISFTGLSSAADRLELSLPHRAAPVDDRPLSVFPDPDPDGVHHATTLGGPVPRLLIHMQAGQTVGAVVAVIAAAASGVTSQPHTLQVKLSRQGCVL